MDSFIIALRNQHSLSESDIYEILNSLATQAAYKSALKNHLKKYGLAVPTIEEGLLNEGTLSGVTL